MGWEDIVFPVVRKTYRDMQGVTGDRRKREKVRINLYHEGIVERLRSLVNDVGKLLEEEGFVKSFVSSEWDESELRRSMAVVRKVVKVLNSIRDETLFCIEKRDPRKCRKQYIARVSDVLSSIEEHIVRLERARVLGRFASRLLTGEPTVVVAGYPNAGKSSLIRKLTGSRLEVRDYPFTTKKLYVAHWEGIRFIDTPGILDRDPSYMKPEERRALAALLHLADAILFVWDPFQEESYQRALLDRIKSLTQAPIIEVESKADMVKTPSSRLKVSSLTGEGLEKLKEVIKWKVSSRKPSRLWKK